MFPSSSTIKLTFDSLTTATKELSITFMVGKSTEHIKQSA
jgi:hypothetical protein